MATARLRLAMATLVANAARPPLSESVSAQHDLYDQRQVSVYSTVTLTRLSLKHDTPLNDLIV